jgi:NTE family protein
MGSYAQKIGLVLSGGGAKGAAHVGVLKALDENNIPIDYITGTSFGAIVGAMYASGYTPQEMEEKLKSEEFLNWAYGVIKETDKFYYKKGDPDPSWFRFRLEKDLDPLKTLFPSSIVENHQMNLRMMELFAQSSAAANNNFDSLMLPFRCVATDVYKSKATAFKQGDLASAIRASITFPLVYKPITIDGVLYMDGGMKNNFPVDVMMDQFNPDVIIGSKVAFNSEVPDPDDILTQIENIFTEYTSFRLPDTSLLIQPSVKDFEASDFDEVDTLIALGYKAALQKIEHIKGKVGIERSHQMLNEMRSDFKNKRPPLVFNDIFIEGLKKRQEQYIIKQIRANQKTFSYKEFTKEYFKLLSDNKIKEIYPRAIYNRESGCFDLHLKVKADYQLELQLGGQINTTSKNFAFIGAQYKRFGKRGYDLQGSLYYGKMYSSLRLKGVIDFPYIRNNRGRRLFPFFMDGNLTYSRRDYFNSTKEWFFEDDTPSYITRRETYFQYNIGLPISTSGYIAIGGTAGTSADNYYQTNIISREDEPDLTRFDYVSPHAKFEFSTLNRRQFETKGSFFKLLYRNVSGIEQYVPGTTAINTGLLEEKNTHRYNEVELHVKNYHRITNKLYIGARAQVFYTEKQFFTNYISTQLSTDEFKPFPYMILFYLPNFRSNTYGSLGVMPVFEFTSNLSFRLEAHVYQPYQNIVSNLYEPKFEEKFTNRYYLANSSIVYQTFMGPIYLSFSYLDRENNPWFVHFGFGFLILNERGLD